MSNGIGSLVPRSAEAGALDILDRYPCKKDESTEFRLLAEVAGHQYDDCFYFLLELATILARKRFGECEGCGTWDFLVIHHWYEDEDGVKPLRTRLQTRQICVCCNNKLPTENGHHRLPPWEDQLRVLRENVEGYRNKGIKQNIEMSPTVFARFREEQVRKRRMQELDAKVLEMTDACRRLRRYLGAIRAKVSPDDNRNIDRAVGEIEFLAYVDGQYTEPRLP